MKARLIQSSSSGDKWREIDLTFSDTVDNKDLVEIDGSVAYHEFLGVGGDLTECTCFNVSSLPPLEQDKFLRSIFDKKAGAGWSLVRDDIGSSDFSKIRYSLAERPDDIDLKNFSVEREKLYNYPVMDQAVKINPDIKFLGSPWSPPAWMKDTNTMVGPKGKLLKKYYRPYAQYLAMYVESMLAKGYDLMAITPQNEPRANHGGGKNAMPQCLYTAKEELDFVNNHLKEVLNERGLKTEIWGMDHNYNMSRYVNTLLKGEHPYSAIAYHHYEGKPQMMAKMKDKHKVTCHFTEGQVQHWSSDDHQSKKSSLAEIFRYGASSFFNWITLLDSDGGPGEGEFIMKRDIHNGETYDIAIMDLKDQSIHYTGAYYMTGHLGRYVDRHAKVVASSNYLKNVCFKQDKALVLYIENNQKNCKEETFTIKYQDKIINTSIPKYAVQTYVLPFEA